MRSLLMLACLTAPVTSACSPAKDLYQKAVVSWKDGSLCVIPNDVPELRRHALKLSNIMIYQSDDGGAHPIWSRSYLSQDGEFPTVSSSHCLDGVGGADSPLPVLQPGVQYSVEVAAGIADQKGYVASRWYSGYFCVVGNAASYEIRQVNFDRRRKVWRWDLCEL